MPSDEKLFSENEVVAEKLWSEKEVAAYLGLTVKALQKRRNKGQPPPYLKLGRVVRYRKEDVEASLVRVAPSVGNSVAVQKNSSIQESNMQEGDLP